MRLFFLFLLFCTQIWAQNPPPRDSSTSSQTIVANRFVNLPDTNVYRVKAGDRLRIRNLNPLEIIYPQSGNLTVGTATMSGQSANTAEYLIGVDRLGQIILPQVGRVKVAGLSKAEVVTEIERRYKNLINDPIFEVEITNLYIKVIGAVARQGIITLENEKLSLGEVIALSGGIDFTTADQTIKLIRKRSGTQEEISYEVRNLSDPAVANIPLYDGDFVFVPPSKGSLRSIKNQRLAGILSPIALSMNALAILLSVYLSLKPR